MKALLLRIASILGGIVFLVLVIGYLAHAWRTKIEPGRADSPLDTFVGDALVVEPTMVEEYERAPGTVRARYETTVSSRILSVVNAINVRAGDPVEQGDILVTLDDRELRARHASALNNVEAMEARLADLQREAARARRLVAEGAIATAELDRLEASVDATSAELDGARRTADQAEAELSHAVIRAPISGRVIDRYMEPGDTASPGVPIVRLYDPASLRLEADVRESIATRLSRGDTLLVHIEALGDAREAAVEEIIPQSEVGSRTLLVKVALPPSDFLFPGMFGRLLIPTGPNERLYIPASAVNRVGQLEFVQALDNDHPRRRFIRTGEVGADGSVEVLSGLRAGERIVPGGVIR